MQLRLISTSDIRTANRRIDFMKFPSGFEVDERKKLRKQMGEGDQRPASSFPALTRKCIASIVVIGESVQHASFIGRPDAQESCKEPNGSQSFQVTKTQSHNKQSVSLRRLPARSYGARLMYSMHNQVRTTAVEWTY